MKSLLKNALIISSFAVLVFESCSKKDPGTNTIGIPPPWPIEVLCNDRPLINARLVPIGFLSEERIRLVSATAGNKILFAGGIKADGIYLSTRVDIYDTATNIWSTAELTTPTRYGMAVATVGNKIFFAGGSDYDAMDDIDWGNVTSRVDIYDAANNTWSIAELSKARNRIAAATIGNKIFFAGGSKAEYNSEGTDVVDIYNNTTNTWTTTTLSEGRFDLSATTVGNKIYFAGGFKNSYSVSKTIDIFDGVTNTWTTSQLQEARGSHASIAVGNKILWAGGATNPYPYSGGFRLFGDVEIKDISTGVSSFSCFIPKASFRAVVKDDNIIFFAGSTNNNRYSLNHFDIYNIVNNQWSTGELNTINDATIISVNNMIYVAGGNSSGKQVWKLEF